VFVPGKPFQPEACTIKLFSSVIYEFSLQARVFVLGKPFQPGLMFAAKTGAYPNEIPFRCSTLGQAPGLTHNITISREDLPGTNTLAYYKKIVNSDRKKFFLINGPGQVVQ
jgi:hypothetical protein